MNFFLLSTVNKLKYVEHRRVQKYWLGTIPSIKAFTWYTVPMSVVQYFLLMCTQVHTQTVCQWDYEHIGMFPIHYFCNTVFCVWSASGLLCLTDRHSHKQYNYPLPHLASLTDRQTVSDELSMLTCYYLWLWMLYRQLHYPLWLVYGWGLGQLILE